MPQQLIPVPNPQWRWFVDERQGRICLDLGELGFIKTKMTKANVLDVASVSRHFSVSDTQLYQDFRERFEHCYFWPEQEFVFVSLINAIAIKQFHKVLPAKNWYFVNSHSVNEPTFLMRLHSQSHHAEVVVLAVDGDHADIMLLDELIINENKKLGQFSTHRVALNRLTNF